MRAKIFLIFSAFIFIFLQTTVLAQSGWIIVSPSALEPTVSTSSHTMVVSNEHYFYCESGGNFVAPVLFPPEADGLSVKQMNCVVYDNEYNGSIYVWLYRVNRYNGNCKVVFVVNTGDFPLTPGKVVLTDTTGEYRLIDNKYYLWFIRVDFGWYTSDLRFYNARIKYE